GRRNVDDKPKSLRSAEKQDQPVSPSNATAPSVTEEDAAATAVAAANIPALNNGGGSKETSPEGSAEEAEGSSVGLRQRIVAPSPPVPVPVTKKPALVPPAVVDKSTPTTAQVTQTR